MGLADREEIRARGHERARQFGSRRGGIGHREHVLANIVGPPVLDARHACEQLLGAVERSDGPYEQRFLEQLVAQFARSADGLQRRLVRFATSTAGVATCRRGRSVACIPSGLAP